MIDNRSASAINQALQKHDTPVGPLFFVTRHGRTKKCLTRKTAIRYLTFFMTTALLNVQDSDNAILTSVLSSTGMKYGNVENQPQSIPAHTSEQSDDCADSSPGNSIQKNGSENMTHGAPDITN